MAKKCFITFGGELRMGGIRILNNLKKYAPDDIEIVDTFEQADFVIMHHQYKHDLDWFLHNCKKPFVFLISELQQTKEYFEEFFSNDYLRMTYTFHPLEKLGYKSEKHLRKPWGVDTEVFNIDPQIAVNSNRTDTIISFGFYDSESYGEIYQAVRMTNGFMNHLDIKVWDFLRQGMFFDSKHHWYTEYVTDEELKEIYLQTRFVSGLRSGSGFEVPILEGMLMGARPICFDTVYYDWFKDFAVYIPEEFFIDMTNKLIPIFENYEKYKVTTDEIKFVREHFGWETIAKNFWKEVLQRV